MSTEQSWLIWHIDLNFTGSVNGVPGTAVMRLTACPQMTDGRWQVIGGTGGLRHLSAMEPGGWTSAREWPDDWAPANYTGTVWLP